ncbi:MAG: hypothetical protein JXB48_06695 [Candidatus Latescibacteria bacterium]|nr:hypothetical protein [Candidatus Latescibacterota bacterium]
MAQIFKTMGRLAGQAVRTQAVDRAITKARGYIQSEMRLADIRLKLKFLRQKRTRHLTLLGRTVYRLVNNDINPETDERVDTLNRVLHEIDNEVEMVESELQRRREQERQRRKTESDNTKQQ